VDVGNQSSTLFLLESNTIYSPSASSDEQMVFQESYRLSAGVFVPTIDFELIKFSVSIHKQFCGEPIRALSCSFLDNLLSYFQRLKVFAPGYNQ